MDPEGHSTADNSRNYMSQVSESNGAFDANFTLLEKVVDRWIALQALLSFLKGIIIMLNLEKPVKKQYIAFRKLTPRNCLYFIGLSHISSFLCFW